MPAPAPALRVGQLGEPLLLTRLLGMEGPRVMALRAPDEEDGAEETGSSLHFPALWVPPGWAGRHWPLALVITGSQQWFWHVCAVQRHQNQAQDSPKMHHHAAMQGKESILPAQPRAWSSQQFYHPSACSCLAIQPWQAAKAGVSESRAGVAPPLQAEGSCTHTVTHGCYRLPSHRRYLPEQLSQLFSFKTGSPVHT